MTLREAINASKTRRVVATDVIDLEISKKQAHALRQSGSWYPYETHAGESVSTWSFDGSHLHMHIFA
jgi:hypothetical protein